jgi:NADH dehydrogenase [ubiquinone] 1 alpha subcomplex assembly factor 5
MVMMMFGKRGMKTMQCFDREAKRHQLNRMAWRQSMGDKGCEDSDFLRAAAGTRLFERLSFLKEPKLAKVLDIGSRLGTGTMLSDLSRLGGAQDIVSIELGERVAEQQRRLIGSCATSSCKVRVLSGDVDSMIVGSGSHCENDVNPFAEDAQFDLVCSVMSLHWVNDLPGLFRRVARCLKPDGVFLANMLGGSTLAELRNAFIVAEQELLGGGVGVHVSPMVGVADAGNLMQHAGFALPTVDSERVTVHYGSMRRLMQDLRAMGETNACLNRRLHMPRRVLEAAERHFLDMHGVDIDGQRVVPVTFDLISVIGWRPHESQPEPLERGSAQHSLKDLGDSSSLG